MPRGIPKDPNHPRNKKRQEAAPAAAVPKRRGRPPGSGKKAAVEAAAPEKAAKTFAPKHKLPVLSAAPPDEAIHNARANIKVISEAIHLAGITPELQSALIGQVNELLRLTKSEPVDGDESETEDPEPVVAAPVAALPTPTLVPVPTNNTLPTPPSFVPPPYPPVTPQ